jgi:predicted O-methyltransferase YrrM
VTVADLDALQAAVDSRPLLDTFAPVRRATESHRRRHGCWAYSYADGTVLGAVAARVRPAAVLELGTALGYTACWWATGGGHVDTVENDPEHVRLARVQIGGVGLAGRVTVHEGDFDAVLPSLPGPYDLAFFDGYAPSPALLARLQALVTPGGLLVTTNLDLGTGDFRGVLSTSPDWRTRFLDGDTAASIRVQGEA